MGNPFAEVIGDPIAHSKSPLIHNFWLEKLGIDGAYQRTRIAAGGLADHLAARRNDPDWRGCNLTMPHKQAATGALQEVESSASRIGAVNTVVRAPDGDRLVGYNTDAAGFVGFSFALKRVRTHRGFQTRSCRRQVHTGDENLC